MPKTPEIVSTPGPWPHSPRNEHTVSRRNGVWIAWKHKYGYTVALCPEIGGEAAQIPDKAVNPSLRSGYDFLSYREALGALAYLAEKVPTGENNRETALAVKAALDARAAAE